MSRLFFQTCPPLVLLFPTSYFLTTIGSLAHALEPKYPGAVESIIDLSSAWNEDALYACRDDIISLSSRCKRCHEHSCRFLAAEASLSGDTYRLALEAVNMPKLSAYCQRLCEREFKAAATEAGRESIRFLSAVTNKGVVAFDDTLEHLCERVYLINDDYGAVSRLILNSVRSAALAAGNDIISCYCPMSPYEKLEHVFIPKLKLGFVTSNRFHSFSGLTDPYRIINSQRFSEQNKLKTGKKRISLNRKAAAQMVEQGASLLAEAKKLHDELETYYIAATDFDKVNDITTKVIEKIKGFPTYPND